MDSKYKQDTKYQSDAKESEVSEVNNGSETKYYNRYPPDSGYNQESNNGESKFADQKHGDPK